MTGRPGTSTRMRSRLPAGTAASHSPSRGRCRTRSLHMGYEPAGHREPRPGHSRHRDRAPARRAAAGRRLEGAGGDPAHCSRTARHRDHRPPPARVRGGRGYGAELRRCPLRLRGGRALCREPRLQPDGGSTCKALHLPLLPGVAKASEVMATLADRFAFLKLFPAQALGSIPLPKAWASPFGTVRFCPTGGITPSTAPTAWHCTPCAAPRAMWPTSPRAFTCCSLRP